MPNKTREWLESPGHLEIQMAMLKTGGDDGAGCQRFFRVADACEYARIGKTKMYELINSGAVAIKKVGRATLVDLDSLDHFMLNLPAERAREQLRLRENIIRRKWRRRRRRR